MARLGAHVPKEESVEVKVGIQHVNREITVETDETAAQVLKAFNTALAQDSMLSLADTKGGSILVRASVVAYLDLGKEQPRRVGFGDI
jgi:mannose/fructose-specific phosphotransferase system component IIA